MQEGWIQLECVDCGQQWQANPANLPAPGNEFTCDECGAERPVAEFVKTQRGYDVLAEFHEGTA